MAQQTLVKKQNTQPVFSVFMKQENIKNLVQQAVGKDAQRFTAAIISAVSNNPALQKCEQSTILSAALLGQGLNLSPSPQLGHYYLVPFEDRKNNRTVAQFQIGYKGYIQLAMRSGQYTDLDVIEIKEGEYKGKDKKTGKTVFEFIEDDDVREGLPTVGYMAYFELVNGFRKQIYWTKGKMLSHADKYSPAFSKDGEVVHTRYGEKQKVSYEDFVAGKYDQNDAWLYSSFWYKSFDEMAFKTMLRQLISKWGIMSVEMQDAFTHDDAVIAEDGTASYVEYDDSANIEYEGEPATPAQAATVTADEVADLDFFGDNDTNK